tara:strand:+ start:4457 stop:5341 length:885 start_codon:yes stop_codon:yes gene_type:complete
MSRNENRTGFPEDFTPQDDTPTPAVATTVGAGAPDTQPAFSWSVPTEFVTLPSGGRFYEPGHPLHNKESVEIKFMTAKEEDILTSRALLKEGVALDRMLQNLVVDKDVRIGSLLIGDKNALLVAARRTGYGADYETNVTCPGCGQTDEFSFDISDPNITPFTENMDSHNVTLTSGGTLVITLPMTNAQVECRMLSGEDEVRLYKEATRKQKKKLATGTMTDMFRSYIVSVNGNDSPLVIEAFIQAVPAKDARVLRAAYSECVPNIDMTQEYVCTNCGHTADMEVPLSADFFWPK